MTVSASSSSELTLQMEEELNLATAAIRKAAALIVGASPEGMSDCAINLLTAVEHLRVFNRHTPLLDADERRGLQQRAEELQDSLATFLALVSQLRAYYESMFAEVARGQVAYSPAAAVSFPLATEGRAFAEL